MYGKGRRCKEGEEVYGEGGGGVRKGKGEGRRCKERGGGVRRGDV